MKKITVALFAIVAIMFMAGPIGSVSAQTAQSTEARSGVMPILYDANGNPVNTSGIGSLPTGMYFLDRDGRREVSYTGGVYYESATDTYGGSVYNPTGRAGAFSAGGTTVINNPGSSGTVGIPNTGVGGNAAGTWTTLALSAAIGVAGLFYLSRGKVNSI